MRAAEVAFCGLHGNVAKQELNLFQLTTSGSAQAGATSTEIVRRELCNADLGSKLLDDVPDELLCHPFAPNFASATHAAEEAATSYSSGSYPVVQQSMHPIRDGNGSNVASLPSQVYNCPMPFALLKMTYRQPG